MKHIIQIAHNIVKNPIWPEANQLAITSVAEANQLAITSVAEANQLAITSVAEANQLAITSVAEVLNSGLPRNRSRCSGQSRTRTRDRLTASPTAEHFPTLRATDRA